MKKNKIRVMASFLAITVIALANIPAVPVYGAEGWTKEGGDWKYLDEKDSPVKNTWKQSKDDWFYLGSDETMLRNTFIDEGGSLYYVDEDGRRLEGQWLHLSDAAPGGQKPGWYHFGPEGKADRAGSGKVKTIIGNKAYVFGDDCRLRTNCWLDLDGLPLAEDDNPLTSGVYYAGPDGALISNQWLEYNPLHLEDTEDLSSEITGRNYDEYDHLWLYFDSDYMRVKSNSDRVKEKTIDGSTYGFDENGIMLPWWNRVASVSNADKSNPTSDRAPMFFSGYDGGKLMKNQWLWMYPSADLVPEDNASQEYSWWRTDDKGKVIQDRIKQINGRYYGFDGLGRMQTGFVLFDGRDTFVAQYDPDSFDSKRFIFGEPELIYGIDRADLYFFSPDELNDGSMQTGEIEIMLEDGVHTFGFKSNGEAYGNKNQLDRVKDTFYINGLRLDADEDYGYGVVKAKKNKDDYRVVDTKGRIVSGQKKLVKDKDGGWIIILKGRFAGRVEGDKPRWHNGAYYRYYDKSDKADPYKERIVGYGDSAVLDELPEEMRLNFK